MPRDERPNRKKSARAVRVSPGSPRLNFAFGLAQARNAVPWFPLAALFQQFQALKAFEHISFAAQGGSRAQTPML